MDEQRDDRQSEKDTQRDDYVRITRRRLSHWQRLLQQLQSRLGAREAWLVATDITKVLGPDQQ